MGDFPSDVTRTAFRKMSNARKREVMIDWFHANYEDPAERTPYETAEGGYQWIWGGPYDAEEEVRETFEGIAPETLIVEVIADIQAHGMYEWAPTPRRSDYDEDRSENEPDSLDGTGDELGPLFGSAEEVAARKKVINALRNLERVLSKPRAPGVGHNRPPSDVFDFEGLPQNNDPGATAKELRQELEKERPQVTATKRLLRNLGWAFGVSARYVGKKIDKTVDAAATSVGKGLGVTLVVRVAASDPNVQRAISAVWHAAMHWLDLATSLF